MIKLALATFYVPDLLCLQPLKEYTSTRGTRVHYKQQHEKFTSIDTVGKGGLPLRPYRQR